MFNDQESIRQRAYFIWESEGRPHGQERRHWDLACLTLATQGHLAPQLGQNDEPNEQPATPPVRPTEPLEPISPQEPLEPISPIEPVHPNNPETPSDPMAMGKNVENTGANPRRAKPTSELDKTTAINKTTSRKKQAKSPAAECVE